MVTKRWATYVLLFAVALVFSVSLLFLSGERPAGGLDAILVESMPFEGEVLASEYMQDDFELERVREYRLTNRGESEMECVIDSKSCGCIGLEKNGEPLRVKQPWSMDAGDTVIVGMKLRVPSIGRSHERVSDLVIRDPRRPSESRRERLKATVAVHRDIVALPSSICLLYGRPESEKTSSEIEVKIRSNTERSTPEEPRIEASSRLADLVELEIDARGAPERISPECVQQVYCVKISQKTSGRSEAIGSSDADELFVRVSTPSRSAEQAGSAACEVTVPVEVTDASQLDSARSIRLGKVALGSPVKRSFCISSRDAGTFFVSTSEVVMREGEATIECDVPTPEPARFALGKVTFIGKAVGVCSGTIRVVPDGTSYQPLDIQVFAEVIE